MLNYAHVMAQKHPALCLWALSLLPLAGALLSQYGFNMQPCVLCIYQRIPYIAIAGLVLLWLCWRRFPGLLYMLCALGFFATAGIAGFHVGVEYGWWEGLDTCGSTLSANSIEALRNQLANAPVSCKDPAFILLGLSMAGWNLLYGLGVGIFCLYMGRKLLHVKQCREKNTS